MASVVASGDETSLQGGPLLLSLLHVLGPAAECAPVQDGYELRRLDVAAVSAEPGAAAALDAWGEYSGSEQGLSRPVTVSSKLAAEGGAPAVYVLLAVGETGPTAVVGLCKTGARHLFLRDATGAFVEADLRCILDVVVHASFRRRGVGLRLLEAAARSDGTRLADMGIDRPSAAMRSLLSRRLPSAFGHVIEQDCRFWVSSAVIAGAGGKAARR